MLTAALVTQIFLVGFLTNLLWEFCHCWLYETCRRQSWTHNTRLLVMMSLKDGALIVLFFLFSVVLFRSVDILNNAWELMFFLGCGLGFAFLDETLALRFRRWEYAASMPTVFGVGITPLLELAATGTATLMIVFWLVPRF